jgi:hypothetical protein
LPDDANQSNRRSALAQPLKDSPRQTAAFPTSTDEHLLNVQNERLLKAAQ